MRRDVDRAKLFTRRAVLLGGAQAGLVGALAARMYYLQVIESDRYLTLAEENRFNLRLLPPPRGHIVDRFGDQLAVNRQNYRVSIIAEDILRQVRTAEERQLAIDATLDALGKIVPLSDYDRTRVIRDMKRRRSFVPVTIRENLTWEEMAAIEVHKLDLPGITIDEGLSRHYPYGDLAAHLLGYVSSVSEEEVTGDPLLELPGFRIGKQGVEKVYDLALRGHGGTSRVEVNALGRVMDEQTTEDASAGAQLPLTIDMRLQSFAARRLAGESASTVIIDIHTGDILSMVSMPAYDPNAFTRGLSSAEWQDLVRNPRSPLTNKAIAGQYSPGSTFKMMVGLAALEGGVIKADQTVFCPGHMELGGHRFHCWKKGGHGSLSLVGALAESCDVYFYELARRCGIDRIAEMARRFGIGEVLDVGLPGERGGLMPTRAWKAATLGEGWHQGETLLAGIGQGYVLTTPLQLAVMTARIANGGLKIMPRLSRFAAKPDSPGFLAASAQEVPAAPPLGIAKAHLDAVRRGMWAVVNGERGTARRAAGIPVAGWEMSGKTGTTQVRRISMRERETGIRREDQLPWELRNHALFVCYAPEDAPRYAVALCVEHGGGGSSAAGPIARDIMLETLRLDPARKRPGEEIKMADLPPAARALVAQAHAAATPMGPPLPPDGLPEDSEETPGSEEIDG
ncbi:penicillin-binding protein 2 [Rhodospirillum rubrum]|uniref:penicillin-binding protein 2 n=1 Tax=Rhodospirillum rubrum TaxID=1085 RepID=UPI001907EA2C|nr:penicillin-binding protein 2 [Rhodospirillum rubrum]MBK1663365.1 penicillin-binding protein 2 [Rhodospirillum rubrum]MBK1675537.1 penicillin-binding protein 2 [Rhodospirillum rubrum]